jgi:hypothetical protein
LIEARHDPNLLVEQAVFGKSGSIFRILLEATLIESIVIILATLSPCNCTIFPPPLQRYRWRVTDGTQRHVIGIRSINSTAGFLSCTIRRGFWRAL